MSSIVIDRMYVDLARAAQALWQKSPNLTRQDVIAAVAEQQGAPEEYVKAALVAKDVERPPAA